LWVFKNLLRNVGLKTPYLMKKFLKEMLEDFKTFALKDRRKRKRKTTVQNLMDAVGQEKLIVDNDFSCLA